FGWGSFRDPSRPSVRFRAEIRLYYGCFMDCLATGAGDDGVETTALERYDGARCFVFSILKSCVCERLNVAYCSSLMALQRTESCWKRVIFSRSPEMCFPIPCPVEDLVFPYLAV